MPKLCRPAQTLFLPIRYYVVMLAVNFFSSFDCVRVCVRASFLNSTADSVVVGRDKLSKETG